jgi:beta-1,4-mannosyltransferase
MTGKKGACMTEATEFAKNVEAASHVRSALRASPQVLMSPYMLARNRYVEIQKTLLRDLGYDVRPMSLKNLLRGAFFQLFRSKNIVVFHWLELRAFKQRGVNMVWSPTGCVIFAFYCLVALLGRAKVVYFVHDHAVHDSVGLHRWMSKKLIALFISLSDFRVVHAPGFQNRYRAQYLPHPLYWDVPGYRQAMRETEHATPWFSVLGELRPYKRIDALLDVWPQECKLEIAGKGSPAHIAKLRDIIHQRKLESTVSLEEGFLSDEEFERRVGQADVMILPHADETMLVSGAFFQASGRVPIVISRATPFMQWAADRFDNVILFREIDELPGIVQTIMRDWPSAASAKGSASVRDEFGWLACRRQYQRFFQEVVDGSVR